MSTGRGSEDFSAREPLAGALTVRQCEGITHDPAVAAGGELTVRISDGHVSEEP